jgi:hypothetical protein
MRLRLSFPTALPLAAGTVAVMLSGCGGSSSSSGNGVADKSPTEILAATKAAADAATSVHVSGSIVTGRSPITLDMHLSAGKGGRGALSESGRSFQLIQTGGTVYIKGSAAFYKQIGGSAAAQLLQGKWLKAAASSSDFASLSQLTDLRQLVDQTLADHGSLIKTGTTTVDGQKVVGVSDKTKGGTLYIATSGQPYPIQISKSGSRGGKVTFDEWNKPVTVEAPANAIDVAKLQSAAK